VTVAELPIAAYALRPPERINLAGTGSPRDHLSNTSLGTFLGCQQRYEFGYEQRLEPAVTATPLEMGRAFAYALETGDPADGEIQVREQALEQAQQAEGNPWIAAPELQAVDVSATVVREAARAYLQRYGQHRQTREVELRARVRNPASGGRYSLTHDVMCRVDAVSDDWRTLFEDKLTGQIPRKSLAARIRLDRQVSIEDYLERIGEEYATRPDHYLVEEVATRSHDDFLRLEQELWEWAEQIRRARRVGVFPRNTGACHDFGGCKYLALCAGEPGAEHQFRVREDRAAPNLDESKQEAA
jgi:hypothetical protein